MITAVSASSGRRNSLFSSVVLPLPKKPVSTVTGMRSSAAVCVFVMLVLTSNVSPPEALGLAELLPRPLELVAAALVAGCGLLGELAQRPGDVFRWAGRERDVVQHLGRHRAVVQGAERALQAHCRLDIGFRGLGIKRGRRKGGLQEGGGVAQLLDGDPELVQVPAVEAREMAAALFDLGVALLEHG